MRTQLPEYWCVASTKCKIPNKYFHELPNNPIRDFMDGDYNGWFFTNKMNSYGHHASRSSGINFDKFILLTLEEFEHLVLNKHIEPIYEIY